MVHKVLIPNLRRQRQADLLEFSQLVYIVSSRSAKATQ